MGSAENTAVNEKPAARKPETTPEPEKHSEGDKPKDTGSTTDSSRRFSQEASKPGDVKSLDLLATTRGKDAPGLKPMELVEAKEKDKATDKPQEKSLSPEAIKKAAEQLHDAAFNRNLWGWGWSSPDAEKVRNLLEPLKATDRAAIEKAYEQQYHHKLRDDLSTQLGGKDSEQWVKTESILNRKDGKSDEAGQVRTALTKLENAARRQEERGTFLNIASDILIPAKGATDLYSNSQDKTDRSRAEADIRKSIGSLTSAEIKEFKDTYRQTYGEDIEQKLLNNPSLSQESKDALKILFQGTDKRMGSAPEAVNNTVELARIGLQNGNLSILKDALETASPEARAQFVAEGGLAKIDEKFSGDDREIARSYVERSQANLGHLIEGDSHWYHTNKDEITRLVTNASDRDRQDYTRGKELADRNETPATQQDKQAADFYKRVHDGLTSAGNPREAALWEAKLMKSEAVISQVLEARDDGGWFGIGAKTDQNKLMTAVENLSEQDWKTLKDHPQRLDQVEKALSTFATKEEREAVMAKLREKVDAGSYEDSQNKGRRSLEEIFAQNKDNPGNRLEALTKMTAQEKQAYISNEGNYRERIDKLVAEQTREGMERYGAQHILKELQEGKKPDNIDKAIIGALKQEDPAAVARNIEAAMQNDPTLLERIKNPQTEDNLQTAKALRQALDAAVDKAGYGDQTYPSEFGPGYIPGRYDEFAKKLFETGKMPIELKVQLDQDKIARFNDIVNATPEEKARLLSAAPDDATRRWQDSVLGDTKDREILKYAMDQGKLTNADIFRAFVNGSQTQPEELKEMLAKMTPDERQDLANEYYTKYNSLISNDVISSSKVPDNEKFRFREMLSPTETHVRQIALDAREERDKHTSPMDATMNRFWDKSQLAADEAQGQIDKFIKEHAGELEKLTPEQRKQFDSAVANYQSALKNYIDSKGAMSEAVVDAVITVAAIGGSVFTGGTSLALLSAVGAGGAVFRVAAMKAMQGTDFKGDPENISRQAFKGFVAAELGFIGPETLGLKGFVKVGEGLAARTAEGVIGRVGRQGLSDVAFKEGRQAAEQLIAREVANVSRQGAIIGSKETEAIVAKVTREALKDSASQAEREVFQQALRNELKEGVTKTLRDKIMNEAESYLINMTAATAGSVGAEVASTAVGLEDPKTLWDRVSASAVSAVAGGTVFHFGFKAAGAGYHGLKAALGKDAHGLYAGEGTIVRHEDGKQTVVAAGEKYRFKQGDKIVETLDNVERPPKRSENLDVDGRPRDTKVRERFPERSEAERQTSRDLVAHDLKEVRAAGSAVGPDGKPVSVYDRLMADKTLSGDQKKRIVDLLGEVREHYANYRLPDGRMLPDQEVNWIHTQGELAKVMESARANKLNAREMEDAMIASMYSDAAKFTDTALTKGNFTTHHLDGAVAAAQVLERKGFPPERIQSIAQAIREHQIAPPEFMGFIYRDAAGKALQAKLASGEITQAKFDQMKAVLDDMTVVGPDKMPRIKQIADINNAPLVKNGNGEWEVAFTPQQREVMKLVGAEHWYVPHDPRVLADGKTPDPEFRKLPESEQARRISAYKSSRSLIDGDGIDNYATVGGASKIVKIRGPETFFKDRTVWDSVASIDKSYDDAYKVLTPEGKRLAQQSLAERNKILNDNQNGIKAQMDAWLKARGKDPATQDVPFYNKELKYPEALNPAEQARMKELQAATGAKPAEVAAREAEIRALKYKGMNESEIQAFEFAKQIRDQMTDFMRMAHRTDGSLPGRFERAADQTPRQAQDTAPKPKKVSAS